MNILLCCGGQGRAVLFGRVDADPVPGASVVLYDARMILYWSAPCGGLLGLAASGPKEGTRISARVERVIETCWQQCLSVSTEAAAQIAGWPTYGG